MFNHKKSNDLNSENNDRFNQSKNSSENSSIKKDKELNPFSQNLGDSNRFNNQFKNILLKQTKISVKELIDYNSDFQNTKKTAGENINKNEVMKILSPIYNIINEIRDKLGNITKVTLNDNKEEKKDDNEIYNLYQNIERNKNDIEDTITYIKETIENVHYEQISKYFTDLYTVLKNLNDEIEKEKNEYYKKFYKIIKEKRRQNIEEGNYNDAVNMWNFYSNNNRKKKPPHHLNYNIYDRDDLMLRNANEREISERVLPELMNPDKKTYFSSIVKKEKNKEEENKILKDNNIILSDEENEEKKEKRKITPSEKMKKYQENMINLSSKIKVKNSNQKPKLIKIKQSKKEIKEPITQNQLNQKKIKRDIELNIYKNFNKEKPNEYNIREENVEVNYIENGKEFNKFKDLEINIPEGMNKEEFEEEIRYLIELYIRESIKEIRPGFDKEYLKRKKIENELKGIQNFSDEDVIKYLIKKLDETKDLIKKRGKNNFNNFNNNNFFNQNINDKIANQIINKLNNQIEINFDNNNKSLSRFHDQDNNSFIKRGNKRIKISERRRREIEKEKEEGKDIKIEEGKRILLFESNDKISFDELDKNIEFPNKINLNDYNVSSSSSYLSNSLNEKTLNLREFIEYHEKTIFSKNIESDNSISKGQALSENNDEENNNNLNKDNKIDDNDLNIKNRTPLDLLFVKNFNENISKKIFEQKFNESEDDKSEESNEIVDLNNKIRLKNLNLYESEEYNNFKNNFIDQIKKNNNNNQ